MIHRMFLFAVWSGGSGGGGEGVVALLCVFNSVFSILNPVASVSNL